MATFNFHLGELPLEAQKIREEIRDFLNRELGDRSAAKRALSWGGFDRDFSRKLGAAGYIGLTWPKKYGGHERTALERYVVLEESLAAGAPTGRAAPSSCASARRRSVSASFPASPRGSSPSPSA